MRQEIKTPTVVHTFLDPDTKNWPDIKLKHIRHEIDRNENGDLICHACSGKCNYINEYNVK